MYFKYLAIASMFRDSQEWYGAKINQVDRFFSQIYSQSIYGDIYCLEGNSKDNTLNKLIEYKTIKPKIINILNKENKNNTNVRSTSDKRRISNLSIVVNSLLESIYNLNKYDYIFWIESDIIIKNNKLIERLFDCFEREKLCGLVAPRVFFETKRLFYDSWGFTGKNTHAIQKWNNPKLTQRFYKLDSIGTCGLFPTSMMVNFGNNGFCELSKQINQLKYNIYVDTHLIIYHPSSIGNIKNRWI